MAESKGSIGGNASANDGQDQVVVVKDKQIDLLSSMLAQKEVELKNIKLDLET